MGKHHHWHSLHTHCWIRQKWLSSEISCNFIAVNQTLTRCLIWLSRRDRDFVSFSLVPRDENEILFIQSQGSRRDREFCLLNLRLRDEIENFCHLILKFETRSRIFNENFYLLCDIKIVSFLFNKYILWIRKLSKYLSHQCIVDMYKQILHEKLSWIEDNSIAIYIFNSTFTFVQLFSRHCIMMRTGSPEVEWKWK